MITTKEQLQKTKIRVNSPEESKRIQERAFELGYGWKGAKEVRHRGVESLYFYPDGSITYGNLSLSFANSKFKEITLQDLFGTDTKKDNNMRYKHIFVVHSENKNLLLALYQEVLALGRTESDDWNKWYKDKDTFTYLLFYKSGLIEFHNHDCGVQILELPKDWNRAIEMMQEEEDKSPIKIGDYLAEFKPDNRVHFGCQSFTKQDLQVIYNLLSPPVNAKINIQGSNITRELIEQINSKLS